MGLVIRGRGTPESWIRPVKEAVWSVDKDQPVFRIRTMQDAISGATSIPRLVLWMLGAFGGVALLMAAVGIYGVIAYNVSRRRQEIGLRQALGASSRDVVKLILHGGFRVALAGLAVGLGASVVMTRALSTLLYEVNTTDPVVLVAVSFLLLTVALAASYLPARRAARLDPMEALRCE
jgi:putative ABC transport system permease protein